MIGRTAGRVAGFGAGQRRSSGRPRMSTGPATRTWRTKTNPSAGLPGGELLAEILQMKLRRLWQLLVCVPASKGVNSSSGGAGRIFSPGRLFSQ